MAGKKTKKTAKTVQASEVIPNRTAVELNLEGKETIKEEIVEQLDKIIGGWYNTTNWVEVRVKKTKSGGGFLFDLTIRV